MIDLRPYIAAWYKMNDNLPSTVVEDSSGNGYHGESVRNTEDMSIEGKVGGALNFNGTTDYVDTGQTFQSTFQSDFSVSLWCKANSFSGSIDSALFGAYNAAESGLLCKRQTNDTILFYYDEPSSGVDLTVDYELLVSTWYHIVCMVEQINPTSITISLYINGILGNSKTAASVMSRFVNTKNLCVCNFNNNGMFNLPFDGSSDNFMLFNKALNQEEIDFLYNGGNGTEELFETGRTMDLFEQLWAW